MGGDYRAALSSGRCTLLCQAAPPWGHGGSVSPPPSSFHSAVNYIMLQSSDPQATTFSSLEP